ncbi:MAG TPA: SDR family oxidoreductase, partial [Arenimonas sp.]|nr:SDR family oxidoreductase [Arenimonas sp.]
IVAEKTGYPVDMLNLSMDLEGDLGIDSIKRVEILAAVEERAAGLPKIDRSAMSALHTLGEIVAYLKGNDLEGNDLQGNAPQEKKKSLNHASAPSPEAITAQAPTHANPALGRYRLERIPAPATGMALPGLIGAGELCILGDAVIGTALAAELKARGVNAVSSETQPTDARAVVYLGGLRDIADEAEAIAVNREAFAIARTLAKQLDSQAGLFVTVQDTGGHFGMAAMDERRAWLSGLPALVKTAALEWPQATLKAIDLECAGRDSKVLAKRLADELLEGGGEIEVMLSADGGRHTLRSVAEAVVAGSPVINAGDVVLVSGGARGVTAGCVIEWARHSRANFVLLGRTALHDEPACCQGISDDAGLKRVLLEQARATGQAPTPAQLQAQVRDVQSGREIRATLAAIAATGAKARYDAVNVSDAEGLQSLLQDVRSSWGPVRGLVHAAGVLADKRIGEKTDAMFDAVFDTKVQGLRALLAATRDEPLNLLAVFSSVSARCGNTGQADYAMANEILAKVTASQARTRPGLIAKSFGWGPWEGGMVTPHLRERFAALGVPMIGLHEGARMFANEMAGAQTDQIELVLGGEPRAEALLFEGASARVQSLEISVNRQSHGYLEGHAIHGQPVLPLVLAAEWLGRAARSFRPGLPLASVHDIKVLKGIRLGGFENGGDRFTIEATPLPSTHGAQMQMRICDANGHSNYSARVELLPEPRVASPTVGTLTLEPWSGAPLYQDLLFHRGEFELIERLDGISDHGISATLRGVSHAGWKGESWQLDVAALDAGLQLAVLFGQRMLGGPNLPTGIDQIRAYGLPTSEGLISATAFRRKLGPSALTTDIVFTDASGRCVAELLGVHNHALA